MDFKDFSSVKKQLVRAGYYKSHRHYLNDSKAQNLTPAQIHQYIQVREKAIKREDAWSKVGTSVWVVVIVGFFAFLTFGGSSDSTTESSSSSFEAPIQSKPSAISSYSNSYSADEQTVDQSQDSDCNPNYSGCVENSPYDLDCSDIGESVEVVGYDEYGLDRDEDGHGCDSY